MTVELPKPIYEYFAADREGSADLVSKSFTEDGTVKDEGNTYVGREAIRNWKAAASKKYSYTVEPFSITTEKGKTVVTSRLSGDFPGSPLNLRYFFVLQGESISYLEIVE